MRKAPGSFLRARSVCRSCAYSIMSRIACLSPWRASFKSDAAHALAPASSASFAFDRFWTSFGPEALAALGGVPAVLVPDNLKAAVVHAAFGVVDLDAPRTQPAPARHHEVSFLRWRRR